MTVLIRNVKPGMACITRQSWTIFVISIKCNANIDADKYTIQYMINRDKCVVQHLTLSGDTAFFTSDDKMLS